MFDIVSIGNGSSSIPVSDIPLTSFQSITALKWHYENYTSPNFETWFSKEPIAGIIFLELDKWLYTEANSLSDTIKNIIDYLLNMSQKWRKENISFFGGLGQSEIYVILKSDDFNDLVDFVNQARGVTYGDIDSNFKQSPSEKFAVFSSTNTIPLISYDNAIKNQTYENIKGEVKASISLQCPPGLEDKVILDNFFSEDESIKLSSFGSEDINIYFCNALNSGLFIKELLEFRSTWKEKYAQLIDTNTTILFKSNCTSSIEQYKIMDVDGYPDLNEGFRRLKPLLASKIEYIARSVTSLSNLRQSYPAVSDIRKLPSRILGEVENYIDEINENEPNTSDIESILLCLIEIAEISLIQRSGTKFGKEANSFLIPSEFGDGVLAPIQAINIFVSNIFEKFSNLYEEYDFEWNGCVFVSSNYGFKYHDGYNFSLPSDAIVSAIGEKYNWLTLTHEISHAVSTIVNIEESEINSIEEAIKRLTNNASSKLKDYPEIRDEFYELFAHWYDYYHFYNEDMDFYQECIWASWNAVPRVNQQSQEYIFRSFAIYALSNLDEYVSTAFISDEQSYIEDKWEAYEKYMKAKHKDVFLKFKISNFKYDITDQFAGFSQPFSFTVLKYKHEEFRNVLHSSYPNDKKQIKEIKDGKIIDIEVSNSYKLLFELRKDISSATTDEVISRTFAIIMSFRNKIKFLVN